MLTDAAPGRGSRATPIHFLARVMVLFALVGLVGNGCSPNAFLVSDEERDRNFVRAQDEERLENYAVAAEYYERALEANPRFPAAHLRYASLNQQHLRRYADAVYHYQRYLRLRPQDSKADDIRHRITNCTEQLATSVPLVIRSETIARDLESVRSENQALRFQVTNLLATVSYWSNEWRRLTAVPPQLPPAYPGGIAATGTVSRTPQVALGRTSAGRPATGASSSTSPRSNPSGDPNALPGSPATFRSHRVQAGETMESIARRYGITGAALQRANPRVEPRRMRAGAILRVPPR